MKLRQPSTWFPLLGKELAELANRRRTYVVRFVYTALLFGAGLLILFDRQGLSADSTTRLGEGREMFQRLLSLQFGGICLFLPAMTAGAFTVEKERDTLTLLLLTTMHPWAIVVQKLLSRVIPMLCYVILSFPLLSVAYSYGGVTTESLYLAMVLLLLTVLHVASLSLMCSAYCRTTVEAFLSSYLLMAVFSTCLPIISPLSLLQPSARPAIDLMSRLPLIFAGILISLLLARGFLTTRAFVPPRNVLLEWFQQLDRLYQEMNVLTGGVVLVDDGNALPNDKPVAWRETSKKSLGTFRYLFRVLVVLEVPILVVAQQIRLSAIQSGSTVTYLFYAAWIIGTAMICVHAAGVVSSERSRQTLESLLTTPMTGAELLRQKLSGVERLLNVLLVPFLTIIVFNHWLRDYGLDLRYAILSTLAAVILPRLIAWTAFLLGLKFRSPMKAVFASLGVAAGVSAFPHLVGLLLGLFGMQVQGWGQLVFRCSPAMIISQLENWYVLKRVANPEVLWQESGIILAILLLDAGILWGLRTYCLRHADQLLGRIEDRPYAAESARPQIAAEPV